jgi:hypothetical protein
MDEHRVMGSSFGRDKTSFLRCIVQTTFEGDVTSYAMGMEGCFPIGKACPMKLTILLHAVRTG